MKVGQGPNCGCSAKGEKYWNVEFAILFLMVDVFVINKDKNIFSFKNTLTHIPSLGCI
jgi:hypothetical protein